MATNPRSTVAPSKHQSFGVLDPLWTQCAAGHDFFTESALARLRLVPGLIRSHWITVLDQGVPRLAGHALE